MHPLFDYDFYIFDCDGVVLDSNKLKIQAMHLAVLNAGFSAQEADACCQFFAKNFGKSRFFHVKHFIRELLAVDEKRQEIAYERILAQYATICSEKYLTAPFTPGFLDLIKALPGKKAVASGSEQNELISIFQKRNLARHFEDIKGSPTSKAQNVKELLRNVLHTRAVMLGDAVADFDAAQANSIDFIGYLPFSNVPNEMNELSVKMGFMNLIEWPLANR